jgi:hypothetical protein
VSPTKQTRQTGEAGKSKDKPKKPDQKVQTPLDVTQSGRLHFERAWLQERSSNDLVELIADLALELRGRKDEPTVQIASPLRSVTFADVKEDEIKDYTRLPKSSKKSAVQLAATTWRIILTSFREGHAPLGLDIIDNAVVGRGIPDGVPADLDLTAYDGGELGVSRQHATLQPTSDELQLIDLGSTNGTMVNGDELVKGKPRKVEDGDTLSFGGLHFKLKVVREPPKIKATKK